MQNVSMTKPDGEDIPAGVKSIYPPILLLIVVGLLIYWTYDYGETARQLPLLISTGLFVLIILDLLSRIRGKVGTLIHLALGAGFQNREMTHSPHWRAEITQALWVVCCVTSMALIGILPTIPTFIFLYMVIQGKQKIVFSLVIAALVVLAVGLVFEIFLEYDLYRGMLLDPDRFG
jgi:hypothetical protein